jgi:general secretion pathway protein G
MECCRKQPRVRSRQRTARRAFTLLEVIVVVTIIALLAALVAPKVLSNIGKSKVKIAQAEASSIAQQVNLYLLDNDMSRIPDDFDLVVLTEGDDPYIEPDDLLDPWGNEYIIRTGIDAVHSDFDVVSLGADGVPGGESEDADLTNN